MIRSLGHRSLWENRSTLITHLASQLKNNSLSLVLGAGISDAFGLPSWSRLIGNMERICSYSCTSSLDDYGKADELRTFLVDKNGYPHYLDIVQKGLYCDVNDDFEVLNERKILDAIAALCIPSRRGSIRDIITFNFDNILEIYLKYYGIISYSPISGNAWRANSDVNVYHIHGFLPKNTNSERSNSIVFDKTSYDDRVDFPSWEWAPKVSSLLRSTTAIYIGLSGNDDNMERFIKDSEKHHAYHNSVSAFWGITFIREKQDKDKMKKIIERWESWKICPIIIKSKNGSDECNYEEFEDEIKSFLFAISQEAAGL